MNASAIRGIPCELSFRAGGSYQHPFSEVEFSAVFTQPDGGKKTVPGFWDGGDCWKLRYSGAEGALPPQVPMHIIPLPGPHCKGPGQVQAGDSGCHRQQRPLPWRLAWYRA